MKPLAFKSALGAMALLLAATFLSDGQAAGPRAPRKSKAEAAMETPTPNPAATPEGQVVSKEIPIPLPVGDTALGLKIPSVNAAGQILSQLMAMKAKRIDEGHLELQGTKIDLNQADGKSDYHIEIPTSIFDLKTRVISSDHAVVIRTQEFELTGEKMRFDTVEKSGELIGKVRMVINNLKQTAGVVPP